MLTVGITGGIGSGKSTVAGIFRLYGIAVYDSDARAKALMNESAEVRLKVRSLFGDRAYTDGRLDRKYLGNLVFNDKSLLQKLNSIVHPAVAHDFGIWCTEHSGDQYVLKEAALIFEAGIYKDLDYTILVTAPEDVRIGRVVARDNTDEQSVRARMANQWPDRDKALLADYLILNDGRHFLLRQVEEVHKFLLNLASQLPK